MPNLAHGIQPAILYETTLNTVLLTYIINVTQTTILVLSARVKGLQDTRSRTLDLISIHLISVEGMA